MSRKIKIAFASGTDELNRALIARMREIFPDLPLWVVSDFPPEDKDLRWIPWHVNRTFLENWALARATTNGRTIRLAGVMLVPNVPFRRMRVMALLMSPAGFLAFNENLNNFMLRPGSAPAILRHLAWRGRNFLRFAWRAARETDWRMAYALARARLAARLRPYRRVAPVALQHTPGSGTEIAVLGSNPGSLREIVRRTHACRILFVPPGSGTPEPALVEALQQRFSEEPEIFCATAVSTRRYPGYVLCAPLHFTLYDAPKLDALLENPLPESEPSILDLELGYRAWQQGWPSVSVAVPAPASTQLTTLPPADRAVDAAYLQFLARTVRDSRLFLAFWSGALESLAASHSLRLVREASSIASRGYVSSTPLFDEASFLALTSGSTAVFKGRAAGDRPRVLIASPYLPFPLSHGGAVRMYNLMRRAARDFDQILICFTDELQPPAPELLDICAEIILVRREGSHELPSRGRPDTVEEFDSPAFHAALRLAIRKWRPGIAQLEFTQMAQYAPDCAPARTLLIEHDVTLDLYRQMLNAAKPSDANWEVKHQLGLWQRFEKDAWRRVDRVVLMSEKDRRLAAASGSRGEPIVLPNGVDVERFRPSGRQPDSRRMLFIGSFAHLPNLMAIEFFLNEVWPWLVGATLHIISGANHEYYLDYHRDRVRLDLTLPGVELEGFVSDVRPSYERATVVVVPLVASAGTNIKVLEAMAMGKAVVSTPAGVNGLDLTPGEDFFLARTGAEMSAAISSLFDDPAARARLEQHARLTVEREYGWDAIAACQAALYRELIPCAS